MAKKKEEPVKRIEDESELDNIDLVSDLLCGDKEIEAISANDIESVDPSKMISTGLIPLDLAFGGGITRGRTYEISGPESHGKSTLCDSVVASWLKTNKHALCLRIESESTMDKIRCKMIGIDLSRVCQFCGAGQHRQCSIHRPYVHTRYIHLRFHRHRSSGRCPSSRSVKLRSQGHN